MQLELFTGTTKDIMQLILDYKVDIAFISGEPTNDSLMILKKFEEEIAILEPQEENSPNVALSFKDGCVYDEFLKNYYKEKNIYVEKTLPFGNLEYCFFSKDKRYPLDKTKLSLYKKGTLANKPILPLLSSGIVMDTIRYFLYNIYNSNITKHYFNNGLISDEDYRILNNTEDNPYSIAPYEFKSLESLIYHHLDKLDHLNRDSKVLRTHKELYDKYCSTYGKDFLKKEKET
jgi:hypothetical protein